MITDNIPPHAIRTYFHARNGKHGLFYVWTFGRQWVWSALGNGGFTDTKEEAEQAAKRWIRDSE